MLSNTMSKEDFSLAERAGLDRWGPATVHATLLNLAGNGASTAFTKAMARVGGAGGAD